MTGAAGDRRCGFFAVVGAPNAGKSTLVNRLTGAKVSIVSPKAQTTRTRVLGIAVEGDAQLVFIDTPGIFKPRRRLDRAMVAAAWGGAADGDLILLLVDSKSGADADTGNIIKGFMERRSTGPSTDIVLVLNKVDIVQKPRLLTLAAELTATGIFTETFMISAKDGSGVDDLRSFLVRRAPPGPWHFPEDQLSDMPQRLLAAEITREKLYLQLRQELPYAATVTTETWEEKKDGSVKISQIVYVERSSQKGIVLGKGGTRLKAIGEESRRELAEIFERAVHLFLFVKVRENWENDPDHYQDWGLDYNA